MVPVLLRSIVRISDFENTMVHRTQTEWVVLLITQSTITTILFIILVVHFGHIKGMFHFLSGAVIIWALSFMNGLMKYNNYYCKDCVKIEHIFD